MDEWDSLRGQIFDNMQLKTTEELLQIWNQNDQEEWSSLAFEIIREILIQRTGKIPDPPAPASGPVGLRARREPIFRLPGDKWIRRTTLVLIILILVVIVFDPTGRNNSPVSALGVLGGIICFCILLVVGTYRAWTLDAMSFMHWNEDQIMYYPDWAKKINKGIPPSFRLWYSRLAPLVFLMAFGIFIFISVFGSRLK